MESKKNKNRRRFLALAFSAAVLAVSELVLRVGAIAPPNVPVRWMFFRGGPVFEREGNVYKTSEKRRKYMPAQVFTAEKSPDTLRIFIAGGSVAMGFPLEGVYGPRELLAIGLNTVDPGRRHEVINVAGFGYASYRVAEVVEEVIDYEPDAIVVMSGHNEYLENRFADEGKGLEGIRLYRVLAGLVSAAKGEGAEIRWEAHTVTDEERELVRADFKKSLERIAKLCKDRGVKLILVTCPTNIRNYRPYGPSAVPREKQEEIDQGLKTFFHDYPRKKIDFHAINETLGMLELLDKKFPKDGWIKYLMGSFCRRISNALPFTDESSYDLRAEYMKGDKVRSAYDLYAKACDLDPWPVRATSAMNEIIMGVGTTNGIIIADAQMEIEKYFPLPYLLNEFSEEDFFFDHCHLKEEIQGQLVLEIMNSIFNAGIIDLPNLPDDWILKSLLSWKKHSESIPKPTRANCYYKIAVETGGNMRRVHRGMDYAKKALELDPTHQKARALIEMLEPVAKKTYRLTGD